jgi:protein subunit release factor A
LLTQCRSSFEKDGYEEISMDEISFETHPSRYRHLKFEAGADRAQLTLKVEETEGCAPTTSLS